MRLIHEDCLRHVHVVQYQRYERDTTTKKFKPEFELIIVTETFEVSYRMMQRTTSILLVLFTLFILILLWRFNIPLGCVHRRPTSLLYLFNNDLSALLDPALTKLQVAPLPIL